MKKYINNNKYKSSKIPARNHNHARGAIQVMPNPEDFTQISFDEFFEMEYDTSSVRRNSEPIPQPLKIEPPQKDEIRDHFSLMREIAGTHRSSINYSRFFEKSIQQINSKIFYKQGMFMKDFVDHYSGSASYSSYFPYYQMMGYEQLRTYFTWRTEVRKGNVTEVSLSYAFLYIYELLNNIGVEDPQDGLNKLMSFRNAFSIYNKTIDKYVIKWIKDYHIYYNLPQSFKEFIDKNDLSKHYPKIANTVDDFDLFSAVSKYDIRKSVFYTDDKVKMITDCFNFVINKLKQVFAANGIQFDETIFQPTRKMSVWQPFKDALFYNWMKQPDKRIVLSENELYVCNQNKWEFNTVITSESGRQLIGFIMKQMESDLRKATKYKFNLSANINTVTHTVIGKLNMAGISLECIVRNSVMEFYKEATKTVVSVDHSTLSQIRKEALVTQEKLIVPDNNKQTLQIPTLLDLSLTTIHSTSSITPPADGPISLSDAWEVLKNALSETEKEALMIVMLGEMDIKQFADEHDVMLEVLIDGINEKTMDFIGDNLLDDEFLIYDDYIDQIKEMVR